MSGVIGDNRTHGRAGTYVDGCRCEACKGAERRRRRKIRARQRWADHSAAGGQGTWFYCRYCGVPFPDEKGKDNHQGKCL